MISNTSVSKNPSTGEFVDIRKYIGVASVHVLAINPNNAKLRSYGWQIPEGAEEPKYVTHDNEGRKSARVRLLVQIQDLDEKPVISLDFWVRPDVMFNKDNTKCKIIDSFGRTAYGTKTEVQSHQIPQYSNGPANISSDYKPCHVGEEELVAFLMKYLNVTPLQIFDRAKKTWIPTKSPGRLTFDNWKALCDGDVSEVAQMIALQPDNRVKVILGIRTTDDNKSYQTFLPTTFIGNGSIPDRNTGEYTTARKAIDKWMEGHPNNTTDFSALPVKEWTVSATEVKESQVEDLPEFSSTPAVESVDDLPFGPF